MGTPSDALRSYLGLATEQLEAHQIEVAFKRELALAAARMARAEKAKERAVQDASRVYCLHPADDPWSKTCRTLCGRVRNAEHVLAPRAASRARKPLCESCAATLTAWKLFGNGKPLTYRRLGTWTKEINMETDNTKTRREAALENALAALTKTPMDAALKDVAAGMLIGLIGLETAKRERGDRDERDDETVGRETLRRRTWHVELVRLKLPTEVLRALRGL